jgi:hypothetical protein
MKSKANRRQSIVANGVISVSIQYRGSRNEILLSVKKISISMQERPREENVAGWRNVNATQWRISCNENGGRK